MEPLGLGISGGEFLALVQHADIVKPRQRIIRFEFQRALEQKLRIVVDVQSRTDIGEQAHRLDMGGVGLQETAAQFLGRL